MEIAIKREDNIIASKSGEVEVYLVFNQEFEAGDAIVLKNLEKGHYLIDLGLGRAIIYSNGKDFIFPIPFNEKKDCYDQRVFTGNIHYMYMRKAYDFEYQYRNVAYNPYDGHTNDSIFPHSKANIETRGESVFASRNAFDGVVASSSHGKWPFESWGINRDPNAELYLEFGNEMIIDRIIMYTRADFPHDAWWDCCTIKFSDGSELVFELEKKDGRQEFVFSPKIVSSLTICNLIKSDDPSPFPALIQAEVYGKERVWK